MWCRGGCFYEAGERGWGWGGGGRGGGGGGGGWHLPYLIFSRFISSTFRNFTLPVAKLC